MPQKHYIITTKTEAAAAAVEKLLNELHDSIDVQETQTLSPTDAHELKKREQLLKSGQHQLHSIEVAFDQLEHTHFS